MHGTLYLICSLLALALLFFLLGAPFIAALQIIIYVGAIMVLFVFIMMLTPYLRRGEKRLMRCKPWWPLILMVILLVEGIVLLRADLLLQSSTTLSMIGPKVVGAALFGPYMLLVQVAALLLLAALVAVLYLRPKGD
jgi:NADH-quinone oxidoreductase subunit J